MKNIKYLSIVCSMLLLSACGSSEKTDTYHSALPIQEKSSIEKTSITNKAITDNKTVTVKAFNWLKGSWKGDLYYGHKEGDLKVSLEYQDDKHIELFYPTEQCHSFAELDRKKMIIKETSMEGECPKNNFIKIIPIDAHEEYIDEGFETLSGVKLLHIEYSKINSNDDAVRGMLEKE